MGTISASDEQPEAFLSLALQESEIQFHRHPFRAYKEEGIVKKKS